MITIIHILWVIVIITLYSFGLILLYNFIKDILSKS